MKLRKFLKNEEGAVLPFVALFLWLFGLGVAAIVVDAGVLYVDRKEMITAADAAALAGAQVLRVNQEAINSKTKTAEEVRAEAETIAENYAIANGADENQLNLNPPYVGQKLVTLPNGTTETRQVVEVTVGKNQSLIFARFLGDENADVKAHAIATWGYVKKCSYMPIFVFDTKYELNTNVILHENITIDRNNSEEAYKNELKTNSYGFLQVVDNNGQNKINEAIEGTFTIDLKGIRENLQAGVPGNRNAVERAVENKIGDIVIIPIINWQIFSTMHENIDNEGNITRQAQNWQLPVMFFAYFEIKNVAKDGGSIQIEGQFTGKPVDLNMVVVVDDQSNPNSTGDTPAEYSKLIQ